MNAINLNNYFAKGFHDTNLLQFLQYDHYDENRGYMLTLKNDGKLDQLYNVTMELKFKNAIKGTGTNKEIFELADQQLKILNRIAEQETNWIVYPLYIVANQLFKISQKIDSIDENANSVYLETCGRTIHRSFNLCLNDRNPNMHENRRIACYMFANLEFQLYNKLQNRDMMKNLVKVLQSRGKELPKLSQSLANEHRSHMVMYNYYMGEYYGCYESDFSKGFQYLNEALLECPTASYNCNLQKAKILVLLIPFAILTKSRYPNLKMFDIPSMNDIYQPIIECLLNGDLKEYDENFNKNEIFFLKNGLYVAMSLIRELILLKLIKNCWKFNGSENILSLKIISIGYLKSLQGYRKKIKRNKLEDQELLDELECLLANLISKGYIKGYLSHSNRCVVLSKTDPFPRKR